MTTPPLTDSDSAMPSKQEDELRKKIGDRSHTCISSPPSNSRNEGEVMPNNSKQPDELDEILTQLENAVARDVQLRITQHVSGKSPKSSHFGAKAAIEAYILTEIIGRDEESPDYDENREHYKRCDYAERDLLLTRNDLRAQQRTALTGRKEHQADSEKGDEMIKTILCIGGRCSSWGQNWPKHLYQGNEDCLRCGMNRKEQWEEDRAAGLVTGDYKPYLPAPKKPITSKQIMYCAVSEEGVEYSSPTQKGCKAWIAEQLSADDTTEDYYWVETFTKAELAAMPEV